MEGMQDLLEKEAARSADEALQFKNYVDDIVSEMEKAKKMLHASLTSFQGVREFSRKAVENSRAHEELKACCYLRVGDLDQPDNRQEALIQSSLQEFDDNADDPRHQILENLTAINDKLKEMNSTTILTLQSLQVWRNDSVKASQSGSKFPTSQINDCNALLKELEDKNRRVDGNCDELLAMATASKGSSSRSTSKKRRNPEATNEVVVLDSDDDVDDDDPFARKPETTRESSGSKTRGTRGSAGKAKASSTSKQSTMESMDRRMSAQKGNGRDNSDSDGVGDGDGDRDPSEEAEFEFGDSATTKGNGRQQKNKSNSKRDKAADSRGDSETGSDGRGDECDDNDDANGQITGTGARRHSSASTAGPSNTAKRKMKSFNSADNAAATSNGGVVDLT